MRILLAEDEKKAREYIKIGLQQQGYLVDITDNGEDALFFANENPYEAIILDVMLPKLDGWTVLKKLRSRNVTTPVIFLTARDAIEDRVHGLSLGADDYLIKPFAFSELLARIQALLRRGKIQPIDKIKILDLEIDFIKHKVTRKGKNIILSPKEFALLTLLAKNQGQVLSRTIIAERVWDIHFHSDTNVIDVAIKRLRHKIGDTEHDRLIHTVRGFGYVFEDRHHQKDKA